MAIKCGGLFYAVEPASGMPLTGSFFGTIEGPDVPQRTKVQVQMRMEEVVADAIAALEAPLSSEQLEELSRKTTDLARPFLDEAGLTGPVIVEGIELEDGRKFLRPAPALTPAPALAPALTPAPFVSAPASPLPPPSLTVEQYASLCVERVMYPQSGPAVAQRYGVSTLEALQSLDAHWQHRFGTEPGLHPRWQQAYQQYEAWLRQQR